MGLLNFEGLGHMYMIANLDPILDSIFYDFFLIPIRHLFVFFQRKNGVFLLEHRISGRI